MKRPRGYHTTREARQRRQANDRIYYTGAGGYRGCFVADLRTYQPKQGATLRDLQNLSQELQEEMRALRTEVGGTIHGTLQSTAELQANAQRQVAEAQNTRCGS